MLSCSLSVMDGLQRLYIKGKAKNAQTHKRTKFILALLSSITHLLNNVIDFYFLSITFG